MRHPIVIIGSALTLVALLLPLKASAQTPLETARAALEDGLYEVAESNAVAVLNDPIARINFKDRARALDYLLRSLTGRKLYDRMLVALDQHATAIPTGAIGAPFTYWRALAQFNLKRLDEVLATQLPPGSSAEVRSRLATLKARTKLSRGEVPEALELFKQADQVADTRERIAENAVEWAQAVTNSAMRLNLLNGVIDRLVDNGKEAIPAAVSYLPLLKADTLLALGRTNEAQELCFALAKHPRLAHTVRQDAYFRLATLVPDQAIASAESALALAQTREERLRAGCFLGDRLIASTNTLSRGATLIKEMVALAPTNPENPRLQLNLALALLQAQRYEEALKELRSWLDAYPDHPQAREAFLGRAEALLAMKDYLAAAESFGRALRLTTDTAQRESLLFRQAEALREAGQPEQAVALYQSLPTNPKAMLLSAVAYQESKQLDRAEQTLSALIARTNAPVELRAEGALRLGEMFLRRNNFAEASKLFAQVAQNDQVSSTNRACAFLGQGQVDYQLYRFESACEAFRSASRLDPKLAYRTDFCTVLALYGQGLDAQAREAAGNYLQNHPQSPLLPEMALWLAKFDFNRGDYASAREAFARFAKQWPDHQWKSEVLLWSAQAAIRQRDYTGTIAILTDLIKNSPDFHRLSEARFLQAECLIELARQSEAVLLLDDIIARSPESDWAMKARLRKADCLLSLASDTPQRYQQAYEVYLAALKGAKPEEQFEINYKAARCLEKLSRTQEALDRYYAHVILAYINGRATNALRSSLASEQWVLKATYQSAELLRRSGRIEEALNILRRVAQAELKDKAVVLRWIEQFKALR